ncbi:hypothetical protein CROQUDRAFT_96636 [Cronartium quercuum f. sp. fusiforme G11]|uniref:Uncharacterized protein n=1 Tax=Cronartium quercuum f. sp. fusiforme G11 TaxID=708437 RepID=A0A9P6NAX3_9BASI|nr:hypothetical protein CROQUDRAFT_96636 [Cronartium quercuum f. sp. fusiforme G11]
MLLFGTTLYSISSINNNPGGFPWTIGNIAEAEDPSSTSTDTGFRYRGDPMSCNATSASIIYHFAVQSFGYGLPAFTLSTQNIVQAQIFAFERFYQRLNLAANALPRSAFPPDYQTDPNSLAKVPITPTIVNELSAWIDGVSYVPSPNYIPYDGTDQAWQRAPQGTIRVGKSNSISNMSEAFRVTFINDTSGIQLGVAGMGGVRPIRNDTNLESLVSPFPEIYDSSLNAMAIMMDMATADVDGKQLGATYTCADTHKEWKPLLSLFAVMFANSAGLFATALAAMIFIARRYDSRVLKQEARLQTKTNCSNLPTLNNTTNLKSSSSSSSSSTIVCDNKLSGYNLNNFDRETFSPNSTRTVSSESIQMVSHSHSLA